MIPPPQRTKIFLQVAPSTKEEDLRELIEYWYGPVKRVSIRKGRNGRFLAFVVFQRHDDAAMALAGLDGYRFDPMVLRPKWARGSSKPQKK